MLGHMTRFDGNRISGFPQDFNLLFNQTAQNDQRWEGYFNGRETFHIENMHPDHPFQRLTLPGIRGRIFLTIERENSEQSFEEIPLVTDTVSLLPHRKLQCFFKGAE